MRVILIGNGKLAYFSAKQFASKGYHLSIGVTGASAAVSLLWTQIIGMFFGRLELLSVN